MPHEIRLMQGDGLVDERLVKEEERLDSVALRVVTWVLFGSLMMVPFWGTERLRGIWVLGGVASLQLLASTLPRAMALWGESDPREVSGEMVLQKREA